MLLNEIGHAIAEEWLRSGDVRSEVTLDEFVVMPNHLHAVLLITRPQGDERLAAPRGLSGSGSHSSLYSGFKASATRQPTRGAYEHAYLAAATMILCSGMTVNYRAREYIRDNPRKWAEDKNNPHGVGANGRPANACCRLPAAPGITPRRTPFAPVFG
jgi:REP element-mobilizing transposase RayT